MAHHEVNLGTHVTSRDGKKLGVIAKLIVEPSTFRVDGFILGKGFLADEKIVTVGSGQVAKTDESGVVLAMDAKDADQLPTVIHEQRLKASGSLTFGGGYSQVDVPGGGDQWVLRGPSGGQLPHTGSAPFFYQAPIGNIVAENLSNLDVDHVMIGEGTDVIGSDAEKIGHVDEIFVDENRQITGVLATAGRLRRHSVRIPRSMMSDLSTQRIRLNVTADDAERLARESG